MFFKINGITSILCFAGIILSSCTGMSKTPSEEVEENKPDNIPAEIKAKETRKSNRRKFRQK